MNMHADTPSPQAVESRARILDAALNAFWKKGYHSTTTREIAAAVGMSAAGVYVYFQSKPQLLAEIVEESHARLVAVLDEVMQHASTPSERLASLVAAFSAFNANHRRTALVAERELGALDADAFERVRNHRNRIVDLLMSTLADGIKEGEFGVDPDEIHDLVLGMVAISKDLVSWYQPGGPLDPTELGALHGKWALRLVRVGAR
ncbi:TetR/AcrR family transcriptional regulator [Ilumatobacter sp.]|uniref:TetR/AcrR family transcriptional regulator n=1 Tax=Ilumatobacter sp. TaxID=1967498 RepID=UPI003751F9E8